MLVGGVARAIVIGDERGLAMLNEVCRLEPLGANGFAALERTAEIIGIAPSNEIARLLRGVLLFRSGQLESAGSALEFARRLGADPRVRLYLGYVRQAQGDLEQAREALQECLRLTDDQGLQQHVRELLEILDSQDE
ncbi:MAG: hypothetical protein O2816_17130 [Planctomycetota bacterium]|nr:hypothetical protein [Planctomycetota bacterium]